MLFFFYIVREKEGFSSNLQEKNNKILFIMLNGALSTNDLWEACQLHLPLIVVLVLVEIEKYPFSQSNYPAGDSILLCPICKVSYNTDFRITTHKNL